MELYLIRHGESRNNAKALELRETDPPLTQRGQRQAECIAETLRPFGLTRIVSSPFLRALQTARPIHRAADIIPEVWVDIHEYGGCCEGFDTDTFRGVAGMNAAEIHERFPEVRIPDGFGQKGWWNGKPFETRAQTQARAERVARQTFERFGARQERVAFVTHGTFKQVLVGALMGVSLLEREWLGRVQNAAITRLLIDRDRAVLDFYNSFGHLPDSLVTGTGNVMEGH